MQEKVIDSVGKNVIPIIALVVLGAGAIYLVIKTITGALGEAKDSILSGNVLKTEAQQKEEAKRTEEKKSEQSDWFTKEKALPVGQKTGFTKQYAKDLADALYKQFSYAVITPTGANEIYNLMSKIGTLGSLYFTFGAYGVRNGKTLQEELRDNIGFKGFFSKDLNDLNKLFRDRKINYVF